MMIPFALLAMARRDSPPNFAQQVQGEWRTHHPKMTELCGQAQQLMSQFDSCDIQHVPREFNSEADAQASRATNLVEGETQEDFAGRGYGRRGY
ncbi:hypothetical protein IGI04_011118 [Brassica rapa subsp. trilocularis]|uniref:RNase H type-1 domain-containing protein n=1 Tax=Brassica rapa subsp. trilocularis TaxID=1813537 RepID=A0ABQ7N5G9_BRACM|nr:hypothetical protein IGI04_011118 [Brassica rapa subsp. trilocularis]